MTLRKTMTETELIREYIETLEGAITYDGCDSALVGTAKVIREEQWVEIAIYSYERLVEHFKNEYLNDSENPISEEEAEKTLEKLQLENPTRVCRIVKKA